MFGKKHTPETILLLSKPGNLNPMYGKKHSQETIDKVRMAKSKYRVELYDLNNNLIKTFLNNVEYESPSMSLGRHVLYSARGRARPTC